MPITPDLFRSSETTLQSEHFAELFEAWVLKRRAAPASPLNARRGLRERSAMTYREMWRVFTAWCVDRRFTLTTIDVVALNAFLDSLGRHGDASPLYIRRMVQLISHLDHFESIQTDRVPNPALADLKRHPRIQFAGDGENLDVPQFLTASQTKRLIDYLTRADTPNSENVKWQDLRNRCALGIQLGGGATPGEAIALKLDQVVITGGRVAGEPWALSLPANGNFEARQTPLSGWAGRLLGQWLQARQQHAIPGDWVFPSTRAGRDWTRMGSNKAFKEVLEAAGIRNAGGGSFFLRHTFALRQLTRHSSTDVARWLGLQDPAMMARYQRVLFQPVDIV